MRNWIVCWWSKRWMLKSSPDALKRPPQWVKSHLDRCYYCYSLNFLWVRWEDDLKRALSGIGEDIASQVNISIPSRSTAVSSPNLLKVSWKRRLWWWVAPQLVLKWAVPVVAGLVVLAIIPKGYNKNVQLLSSSQQLVLVTDETLVSNHPGKGLKVIAGAYPYYLQGGWGDRELEKIEE